MSRNNQLIYAYLAVLLLLLIGVIAESGTTYIFEIGIYIGSLLASYYLFKNMYFNSNRFRISGHLSHCSESTDLLSKAILIVTSVFVVIHFNYVGYVPLFKALCSTDFYEIAKLRQGISETSPWFLTYGSSLLITALMPFFLLYFWCMRKKTEFYILIFVSVFYSLSLLQKSFIITICLPLLVYLFIKRQYFKFTALFLIPICGILLLVLATNPQIRPWSPHMPTKTVNITYNSDNITVSDSISRSVMGIGDRILLIPGKVIVQWFKLIPDQIPYGEGNGYKIVANLKGQDFINYPRLLYDKVYPDYTEIGLRGTLNVASFMVDYANYGRSGLILAGATLSLLLVLFEAIFRNAAIFCLALNIFPILALSSSALSTLLFSGGWGLTILLYWTFRDDLEGSV